MPSQTPQKWLALMGLAIVLGFVFQGTRGLWDPDEGRYAEVAREMLSSGDFINPRLDGQPHFTKPPLTYWCIAGSMAMFGRDEWVVRFFVSLAFALTVLVVAGLGARIWDRKTGLLAGLIYATSLTPFAGASFVTPDTLLTLWEALALYSFWRGFTAESHRDRFLWPTLTGAAFGLAFLTKGPPGLVFLPGMLLFRFLPTGRRREAAPVLNLTGLVLFAVLGLSWYVVVIAEHRELLSYFVREEIFGRIAGHHHRNPEWYGPIVIYGPALLLGSLPWCLFWPRIWRALRATSGAGASVLERPAPLFLCTSLLLAIAVFTLVRSRLPLYVLPLFVPLALMTARAILVFGFLPATPPRRHLGSHAWAPRLALWTLILLCSRLALALWPSDRDARRLYRSLPPAPNAEFVVASSRAYPGLAFYARRNLEYVYWSGANADSTARADHRLPITEEIAEGMRAGSHSHLYLVQENRGEQLQKLLATAGANIVAERRVGSLEAILTGPPPS
jgi:4-amino-4-deoxy-L-arabinose transferase-like glycosyltransferase